MKDNKKSVVEIQLPQKKIYLLGTAHISKESVQEVIDCIEEYKPHAVIVELDKERLNRILKKDNALLDINLYKVIKEGKGFLLLTSIVLSAFQRRLGEHVNTLPGSEMVAAVKECEKRNIPVVLADRPINVTLRRAWQKSSLLGRVKILSALMSIVFSRKTVDMQELDELKTMSLEGNVLDELSKMFPDLKKVLLDERDEYMVSHIHVADGSPLLGVFGAAHVPGIKNRLMNEDKGKITLERKKELESISKKKKTNFLTILIPAIFVLLISFSFARGGWERGVQNIFTWWVINGGLSLLGALVTFSHPVTMLVSFLAAPITSLIPVIGVGMFTGFSETYFRTPTGRDIVMLPELNLSLKSLYKNRIARILLVVFATTLGSALGTAIGFSFLAVTI